MLEFNGKEYHTSGEVCDSCRTIFVEASKVIRVSCGYHIDVVTDSGENQPYSGLSLEKYLCENCAPTIDHSELDFFVKHKNNICRIKNS